LTKPAAHALLVLFKMNLELNAEKKGNGGIAHAAIPPKTGMPILLYQSAPF